MAQGMVERIEEAAAAQPREAVELVRLLLERLYDLAPWTVNLAAPEALAMLLEVTEAAREARESSDRAPLVRVLAEWEATAEAKADAQFQAAISRPDRRFVRWTD